MNQTLPITKANLSAFFVAEANCKFPMEAVPAKLAAFVSGLSQRYDVEPHVATMACLTVAVAALGRHASIRTGWGASSIPCNLFTIVSADRGTNVALVIDHIVEPIRSRQQFFFDNAAKTNPEETQKALGIAQIQRSDTMRHTACFHDNSNYIRLCWVIDQLSRSLRPVMLFEDFRPASLRKALRQNCDGGLLFLPEDLVLEPKRFDQDMLPRCINRRSFLDLFPEETPPSAANAAVSGLAICRPQEFQEFVCNSSYTQPEVLCGSIFLNSDAKLTKVNNEVLKPISGQREWEHEIKKICSMRSYVSIPLGIDDDAAVSLFKFHNQLVDEGLAALPLAQFVPAFAQLSWRIAFALWLTGTDRNRPLSQAIAESAVAITKWYLSQRPLLVGHDQSTSCVYGQTDDGVLLTRIRHKGPIKRRELYRTFDQQSRDVHEPGILRLLAAGLICEDAAGRLIANKTATTIDV